MRGTQGNLFSKWEKGGSPMGHRLAQLNSKLKKRMSRFQILFHQKINSALLRAFIRVITQGQVKNRNFGFGELPLFENNLP